MEAFVRRYLAAHGLQVKDEEFMRTVLPYYTGECANQTFEALIFEAKHARRQRACHPAWVVANHPKHPPHNTSVEHTLKDVPRAQLQFLKGVMFDLGVRETPGHWKKAQQFADKMYSHNVTADGLKQALADGKIKKWATVGRPLPKASFTLNGNAGNWLAQVGSAAPLNEFGYQAVLFVRDEAQMQSFIRKVAKKEGLAILDEEGLKGMTPYYSGMCARQSYDALVRELHSMEGTKFNTKMIMEFAGETLPSKAHLLRQIAEKAGVHPSRVTIERADSKQLENEARSMPVKTRNAEAEKAAALQQAREALQEVREVSAKRVQKHQRRTTIHITVSLDSMDDLKRVEEKLGTEALYEGLEGHIKASETRQVSVPKPAQCGGGVVTRA